MDFSCVREECARPGQAWDGASHAAEFTGGESIGWTLRLVDDMNDFAVLLR